MDERNELRGALAVGTMRDQRVRKESFGRVSNIDKLIRRSAKSWCKLVMPVCDLVRLPASLEAGTSPLSFLALVCAARVALEG